MKVRSAILREMGLAKPYAASRPLSVETVSLAPPGPGEVLVKIAAAGLCHSDLSGINGDRPRPMPTALGHEAAGVVVEPGPGVSDLLPGDHVVMSFIPACGVCAMCAEGRPHLCEPGNAANIAGTLLSGARRFSCDDGAINHHCGVCAFSEFSVISRRSIVKIRKDIPLIEAALFGCAVMTGVGAVMNTCKVRPGQSVAIIGLGGVGLSALLGAVASGAGRIIAIDLNPAKLTVAKELGATDGFLASDPDIVRQVREATGGGVDHAIEFAGAQAAFELGFAITRRGGVTASAGLPPPPTRFAIPAVQMVAEERIVLGSYQGSCVPSRDIPRYIDLYLAGKLPVNKLLSGTGPLEEINAAFDRLDRGEIIRHVIVM
ncbi:MAG: zinc-dependent alcohol dehydrogenase family protein [Proteobacteria bacterium]|nr:zinc-dependent alcohol dehydrogenase family protein [Pseudomonadota bacterium]